MNASLTTKVRLLAACAALGTGALGFAGPASAVACGYPDVCVQPITIEPEGSPAPSAPVAQPVVQPVVNPAVQQAAQLPVTGTDVSVLAGAGALLVGAGVVLVRRSSTSGATSSD